jgi:hypothetical protein
MTGVAAVVDRWRRHHEVSILIAAGAGGGSVLRLTAAREGFDDDHAATAAGARTWQHARFVERCGPARLGLFGAGRHGEQLARLRDVGGTVAAGKQPVVTDAVEAPGQHVHQEAPDELVGG